MDIQDKIISVLKKYGVKKASLFGSFARGDFDHNSDIDLLIEAPHGMGMQFFVLKHELEDTLDRKIDLITYKGLDKYLKPYILQFEKQIL